MMFGSDWPVCLLAGSYTDITELAEALVSQLSVDEQAEFFAGTAMRSYAMPQLTASP